MEKKAARTIFTWLVLHIFYTSVPVFLWMFVNGAGVVAFGACYSLQGFTILRGF
ncbi:hypothetical protein BDV36DRAFT_247869 [Aspergillus pseudocaelatus]|uniref:Uncharacterized protein n=1 Tax=Aspergillus pseudocaelatus TaxID=1825620 RepID=A0ABQ6WWF2_9EURO|nr:hypothetical protein BDV36DRAFT_247869 [Aspergillus pseudocaelatus]